MMIAILWLGRNQYGSLGKGDATVKHEKEEDEDDWATGGTFCAYRGRHISS